MTTAGLRGEAVDPRAGVEGDKQSSKLSMDDWGAAGREAAHVLVDATGPRGGAQPTDRGVETVAAPMDAEPAAAVEPIVAAAPVDADPPAAQEPAAAAAPAGAAPEPAQEADPMEVAGAEPAAAATEQAGPAQQAPAPASPAAPGLAAPEAELAGAAEPARQVLAEQKPGAGPESGPGLGQPAGRSSGARRQQSGSPSLPAAAAESDPLAGDNGPSPGANDSDYCFSDEGEGGGSGGGSEEDSDYVFSDEEDERRRKRWLRPTPEGARRSKRFRSGADTEPESGMEGGGEARRGQEGGGSTAQPSRAGSEDVSEVVVSPLGLLITRELSSEQVEADLRVVQGMWEMASALDFLRRFRPQLKLSRDFGADELERVIVTSAGDGGLLADVHIDLMKGISPKSDISAANWAIHLANKIKYHWKPLLGIPSFVSSWEGDQPPAACGTCGHGAVAGEGSSHGGRQQLYFCIIPPQQAQQQAQQQAELAAQQGDHSFTFSPHRWSSPFADMAPARSGSGPHRTASSEPPRTGSGASDSGMSLPHYPRTASGEGLGPSGFPSANSPTFGPSTPSVAKALSQDINLEKAKALRCSTGSRIGSRASQRALGDAPRFTLLRPQELEEVQLGPMIGSGSFGRCYRGVWHGAAVAVKILDCWKDPPAADGSLEQVPSDAEVEALLSRSLAHPYIVPTFNYAIAQGPGPAEGPDAGKIREQVWILQAYCSKGTLLDAIERGLLCDPDGQPDPLAIVQTASEIAAAMHYLHTQGILHGDLTPNNVLLSSSNKDSRHFVAQVADFGLAKAFRRGEVMFSETYGTVTHMPPELLVHGELTPATDVFSFGVLLYEMWAGHHAWADRTVLQIMHAVSIDKEELVVPESAPPKLQALMRRCLDRDPAARPSFQEVLSDLGEQLRTLRLARRGATTLSLTLDAASRAGSGGDEPASLEGSGRAVSFPRTAAAAARAAATAAAHPGGTAQARGASLDLPRRDRSPLPARGPGRGTSLELPPCSSGTDGSNGSAENRAVSFDLPGGSAAGSGGRVTRRLQLPLAEGSRPAAQRMGGGGGGGAGGVPSSALMALMQELDWRPPPSPVQE